MLAIYESKLDALLNFGKSLKDAAIKYQQTQLKPSRESWHFAKEALKDAINPNRPGTLTPNRLDNLYLIGHHTKEAFQALPSNIKNTLKGLGAGGAVGGGIYGYNKLRGSNEEELPQLSNADLPNEQLDNNSTDDHTLLALGGIPVALGAGIGAAHLIKKMRRNN